MPLGGGTQWFILLISLAGVTGIATFTFPPRRAELTFRRTKNDVPRVAVALSRESEEKDSREESRLPFFARALQKLRKNNKEEGSLLQKSSTDEEDKKDIHVDSEADVLRALAKKTRLEAERMDILLTLDKIDKLEENLSGKDDHSILQQDRQNDLLRDIQLLMQKINAPQQLHANDKSIPNEISSVDGTVVDKSPTINEGSNQRGDEKNIVQEIIDGEKPLLSEEKREDAIDGFDKLPEQVKDMMAKSVGMADGNNSTAVIDKLMAENRLFEGDEDERFSMTAKATDIEDIFIDLNFAEVNSFVRSLLPEVTRKEPVNEEYIDVLYSEVLGKDTFNPIERKPIAIPGGYLIRGESKVKPTKGEDEGDILINALDEKLSKSSVAGKIQLYYILDPTPPSGEEIMRDEDQSPVILVTNSDISPDTDAWVKPTVTFLGLVSIAAFSLGSFAFNEEVLDRVSAITESGDGNFDWLYDLSLPLAFSVLVTQIAHEAGHLLVAFKDGIIIGIPTIVPGFQFGITGALTPIKSSPKNIKSLFDFAIAGPLFGLAASLVLLYLGLEMTAFMDTTALPSIPVELLRSSALAGGIVDYLLGGVLDSPNSQEMLKLHPYAIAGFGGVVQNALSLMPIVSNKVQHLRYLFTLPYRFFPITIDTPS